LMSLKSLKPDLPVIVISGYTTANAVKEILALGAFGYLQKPFKKEELAKMMIRVESESGKKSK